MSPPHQGRDSIWFGGETPPDPFLTSVQTDAFERLSSPFLIQRDRIREHERGQGNRKQVERKGRDNRKTKNIEEKRKYDWRESEKSKVYSGRGDEIHEPDKDRENRLKEIKPMNPFPKVIIEERKVQKCIKETSADTLIWYRT